MGCIMINYKEDNREPKGGWAKGNYTSTCHYCKEMYIGDKRSVTCADCAYGGQPHYKPCKEDKALVNVPNGVQIKRRVVAAANKYYDTIIVGIRHYCPIMHSVIDNMDKEKWKHLKTARGVVGQYDQGFVDQWGNFMTRKEAGNVVKANGQWVRNKDYDPDYLFSEDVW